MVLAGRRVIVQAMSVIGTAIIARALGVESFGQLSSALAAYWLAASASDFGFSLVLGRDLAAHPDGRGRLLRASFRSEFSGRSYLRPRSWRSALRVASHRRVGSCCSCSLRVSSSAD